jgi:hypothetical protein
LAGIGGHWFSPLGNPRLRSFHPTDQR